MRRALLCLLAIASGAPGLASRAHARARPGPRASGRTQNPRYFQWRYRRLRRVIEKQRLRLAKAHREAPSPAAQKKVRRKAWMRLIWLVHRRLFPFWYGTRWTIRGSTRRPRTGSIACGTFVSTILAHASFRVERDKLGAQNSPELMKTLTTSKHIQLHYNWPIRRFVRRVRQLGNGLYMVGLDMHVGFLLVHWGRVYFVHSSYGTPAVVVKERALKSPILTASRFRLVAKLSHDDTLIRKWLAGTALPTYRKPRKPKRRPATGS
jgi:hypothetical protein